jgi:predicted RNase H-like HicB family nuclease
VAAGRAGCVGRKPVKVSVQAEFKLFGVIKREGKWYIAYCPPLDLTTQGRTKAEAKRNLLEACQLFIMSCLERGTLDQALRELGFVPQKDSVENIPKHTFPIAIPIPFGFEKSLPCRA